MYDRILKRISHKDNAFIILQWLICAVRPLKLKELVELTRWGHEGVMHNKPVLGGYPVLKDFSSLITVSGDIPSGEAVVAFAHHTVQEYLSGQTGGHNCEFFVDVINAHCFIARFCLDYLRLCDLPEEEHGMESGDCKLRSGSLLEYSINNWYKHALKAPKNTGVVDAATETLVDGVGSQSKENGRRQEATPSQVTYFGIGVMVVISQVYNTVLLYIVNMFITIVSGMALLQNGGPRQSGEVLPISEVDTSDICEWQRFSTWVESTKSLLDQSDMDASQYRRAIKSAAYRGYEKIVGLLLEHKAPVNARCQNYNVLTAATSERYQIMIMLLLGVDVGFIYGALWWPEKEEEGVREVRMDGTTIVRSLLLAGADVLAQSELGETALHQAAGIGNEAMVRILLARNANAEANCKGYGLVVRVKRKYLFVRWVCRGMPLHWAACDGRLAVVRLLLDEGANIAARVNDTDETALHIAALAAHETVVQLLLERGADVAARDSDGWTALHAAASGGSEVAVKLLLERDDNIDARTTHGQTPLHLAASCGCKAVVRLLLDRGANVNEGGKFGLTALHMASGRGHKEVLQLLLDKGADIKARSKGKTTALHVAASYGHEVSLRLLLERGADLMALTEQGSTALYCAALRGHGSSALLLLAEGADITTHGGLCGGMLQTAAFGGNEATVEALLDRGMDFNVIDGQGRTLLHFASSSGNPKVISKFLELGLAASARDIIGRTSLHFAATSKSLAAVELVLGQDGIQPSLPDLDGWTPLHWASRRSNESVVKLLSEKVDVADLSQKWPPMRIARLHNNEHLAPIFRAKHNIANKELEMPKDEPVAFHHFNFKCAGCFLVSHPRNPTYLFPAPTEHLLLKLESVWHALQM